MKQRTQLASYKKLLNQIFSYIQVAKEFISKERGA